MIPVENSWEKRTKEKAKNDVRVGRENVNVHRDQGIVERFTRTLSERLFSYQYTSQEMNFRSAERSREWVKSLPKVVLALNGEKTRLTGKKTVEAIKEKLVSAKSSTTQGPWVQKRRDSILLPT